MEYIGSLGQEIHRQPPSKPWVLISGPRDSKYRLAGSATSLTQGNTAHRSRHPPSRSSGHQEVSPKHFVILANSSGSITRKEVLQEQNGQGKFDNPIGHHLSVPGQQPRTTPREDRGEKQTQETVGIPRSKLVIILPANGTVHHRVHIYKE